MSLKNISILMGVLVFSIGALALMAADFPTDEQIAKIVTTTNDGEIAMAKLAEDKATNKDVKKFAEHMVKDHSKNNKSAMKLSRKLNMTPTETQASIDTRANDEKALASLQALNGVEFDRSYMSMQVNAHQKVLNDLDNVLIPGAKNAKLKKELEKTRKKVAEHLEHAKEVQAKL